MTLRSIESDPIDTLICCTGDRGWMHAEVKLQSEITCPECGHRETETMPTDACQWYYECKGCGALLKPLKGDCCVFCSYGTVPCPPIQLDKEGNCCSHDTNCCE